MAINSRWCIGRWQAIGHYQDEDTMKAQFFALRIRPEIRDMLRRLAALEQRSMVVVLDRLLREELARREKGCKEKQNASQ